MISESLGTRAINDEEFDMLPPKHLSMLLVGSPSYYATALLTAGLYALLVLRFAIPLKGLYQNERG